MTTIALRYDLRAAPFAATKHPEQYTTCLDQVAWADENGVGDVVVLSEHHAMEDGFIPAPFTMAAAVAARTKRLMISIAAALIPLHDPLRLAEQIAVLDLLSGGRVNLVAGAGYATHEFEMAGIEKKQRGKLLEEHVEVMLKAWTGEPFEWRGRSVQVTPVPKTKPHPLILMGGSSEAAARRAARLGLPFFPALGDQRLVEWYQDEAEKVRFEQPFALLPHGPGFVHVTEDPDAAWSRSRTTRGTTPTRTARGRPRDRAPKSRRTRRTPRSSARRGSTGWSRPTSAWRSPRSSAPWARSSCTR